MSSSTGSSAPPPKEKGALTRLWKLVTGEPKKGEGDKKDEDTSKRFHDFFERT